METALEIDPQLAAMPLLVRKTSASAEKNSNLMDHLVKEPETQKAKETFIEGNQEFPVRLPKPTSNWVYCLLKKENYIDAMHNF